MRWLRIRPPRQRKRRYHRGQARPPRSLVAPLQSVMEFTIFSALVVDKNEDGSIRQTITALDESRLPEGDVTVRVAFSTLNYKDGP